MKKLRSPLKAIQSIFAVAVAAAFCSAAEAGPQTLRDSIPPAISHLSASGRLDPKTRMNLSIGLPLRNEGALDSLLGQLYDPASPNYHHYLTQEQFIEQFAPSATDYQTVASFFGTNGFTVTERADRMVLDVSGSSADVERVFHINMRTYQHPKEHRTFFGPDTAPSLSLGVPILHISGLDNYAVKRPKLVKENAAKRSAKAAGQAQKPHQTGTGSGPDGEYLGNDFRAAYIPGVSLTGTGQTLGLLEFDGFYASDISTYESDANVSVPETIVPVDGGVSTPGGGDDEVSLDIEEAMSIAPGLTQIVVYEENPDFSSWEDLLDAMANDTVNSPKQFSCSWGDSTADVPNLTAENIFKQMDAQGQTFYDASGDGDAIVGGIPFPAESTNIVQVGGTTLTTTGGGGARIYETTWNWGGGSDNAQSDASVGTSGGVSENYALPPWQQGISMAANEGSTTMRNVPDVAMIADNVFVVAEDGGYVDPIGGTSCAAPAWGAFTALANEQAAAYGKASVGFAAPAIYAAAKGANYLADFNDITTGNNYWAFSVTSFPAVAGYDLCTGWGTPIGDNLIDMLAGVGDALAVAPGRGFVAFGPAGGDFSAETLTFSLTNSSASALNWSLINTSSWLTASSAGGALAAHAATQVTVNLSAAAFSLPAGNYIGGVLFSNQTTHAVRTREFVLDAGQNLVRNGNFAEFPYELPNWSQTGGIGMYNETPYPNFNYDYTDDGTFNGFTAVDPNGQFCVFQTAGTFGYISEDIATVPGQTYELSFDLMNATNSPTEVFEASWNGNTIYDLDNPPPFSWSNIVVNVTATSSTTTLQFGGRCDAVLVDDLFGIPVDMALWGLDDVTLIPMPSVSRPTLSLSKRPNAVALSWNSRVGQEYQVQYATSLHSPNWVNLSTNTATGPTLSVTNTIGGATAQIFYRVLVP